MGWREFLVFVIRLSLFIFVSFCCLRSEVVPANQTKESKVRELSGKETGIGNG